MRYIAKAVALAVVLALIAPYAVLAADYIKDTAEALKLAPVYVAPGTEGTDNDTAGKLQARLNSNDNIVLVMLPTAAEAELEADISTIASRLSEAMGNQRIIGLAVGKNVVGYAPTLPASVAADQMRRARSVSNNDPVTTLGTFTQNVHIWQREHPQPTPPLESPSNGISLWFVVLVILISAVIVYAIVRVFRKDETDLGAENFNVPNQVEDQVNQITQQRILVQDLELREALYQICVHVEKYFQLSSKDKKRDALIFRVRLTEVVKVLVTYIKVQNNPDFYNNSDVVLRGWKEAFIEFDGYVLDSIKRGTDVDLREYRLRAEIMQAQRSAASPEE